LPDPLPQRLQCRLSVALATNAGNCTEMVRIAAAMRVRPARRAAPLAGATRRPPSDRRDDEARPARKLLDMGGTTGVTRRPRVRQRTRGATRRSCMPFSYLSFRT
jgi:hypothetical protein